MKSQPDYQAALKETISEGLAVIVVGTGVSIAASFDAKTGLSHPQASWTGLLEDGLKWLKEHKLIDDEIAEAQLKLLKKNPLTHRFISAAEDITAGMGGAASPHFAEWLKRTVGSIRASDRSVLDALDAIRLQRNLLATTNYDGLLLDGNTRLTPVTWQDTDALIAAVRSRDADKIIFLHGHWRRPESVILDWKSYDRIARDEHYRSDLAAFWKTSIWVYVGCGVNGLGDPDFGLLLERYGERATLAGHWDYCLVREDQRDEFQAHFDKNKLNVRAISFGKTHADLPEYLHSLLPAPLPTATSGLTAATAAPDSKKAQRASKIRSLYLKDAGRDFEARLAVSIHHARFVDLGIQDDPAAIKPAWGYHNPETRHSYETVGEAFIAGERRLLLLGPPGSGKTTALFHLASQLVQEAEKNLEAPIPFVFNLSKFRIECSEGAKSFFSFGEGRCDSAFEINDEYHDTRFEDWLLSEMATFPGISRVMADEWITQGSVAVLLDGLDEFNDERRADLVRLLNDTFLRYYPDLTVVVCSRTNEYLVLQSSEETRLQLRGCAHLQALTDQQVAAYLKAAQAEALLSALPDDPALRELASTPLTLSMLVLAYGGLAPSNLPRTGSLSESRNRLFESYVARMLQRRERRKRNVPFDDIKSNDVPISEYSYHPVRVHRWLAWLALALSLRMRTNFSVANFHSILSIGASPARQPFNFTAVYLALGVLLAASLCLTSLLIVPLTSAGLAWAALISFSSVLLLPLAASRRYGGIVAAVFALFAIAVVVLVDTAFARELCAILPGNLSPMTLSALLPFAAFTLILSVHDELIDKLKNAVCFIVAAAASIAFKMLLDNWQLPLFYSASWQAGVTAVLIGLSISLLDREDKFRDRAAVFAVSTLLVLPIMGAAMWIPELSRLTELTIVMLLFVLMLAVAELSTAVLILVGFSVFAWAGAAVAEYRGAILSIALFGALCSMCLALKNVSFIGKSRFAQMLALPGETLCKRTLEFLDRMVFSPLLWKIVAIAHRFPWRNDRFILFCKESFLLKQSSQEWEFTHRLLRDYFALSELRPKLSTPDGNRRLELIRLLGYQGEAALDLLSEFAEDQEPSVRAAAITGVSHIASPITTRCLGLHLNDHNPLVRQAIVTAIFTQSIQTQDEMLTELVPLGDGCEFEPLLSGIIANRFSRRGNLRKPVYRIFLTMQKKGERTKQQLKNRLRSRDKQTRLICVEVLAQFYDERVKMLLSKDVDGIWPWLDPATPISMKRVFECARKLHLNVNDVLASYRILADEFGLKLGF